MTELLLPCGYKLESGQTVVKKIQVGNGWQIFTISDNGRLLVIEKDLAEINFINGVLPKTVFTFHTIDNNDYYFLESEERYELSHIKHSQVPKDLSEAKAFSFALTATRRLMPDVGFLDAIYIEKFSRLLIVGKGDIDSNTDDLIFGRWITGGVNISINNLERIKKLSGIEDTKLLDKMFIESGISEYVSSNVKKSLKGNFQLIGRHSVEKFLIENVIDIIDNPEVYSNLGIEFPTPFVLYGLPGCGKTYAVDKLVDYLAFPLYQITSNTIGSPYIHETSKKVSEIFEDAIKNAPSIIVIDEMDSFLGTRSSDMAGQHHVEEVNEFLRLIPKAIENKVLIVGMTNQIEMLDPAVIRRGRFDFCIEVEMPSKQEIEEIFEYLISDLPHCLENKCELYNELYGRQPSDVAFVVKEAGRIAARNRDDNLKFEYFTDAINKLPKIESVKKIGFI